MSCSGIAVNGPDPDKTKAQLLEEIGEKLTLLPGNAYEISQPIQLRFNELISGVRSDLGGSRCSAMIWTSCLNRAAKSRRY